VKVKPDWRAFKANQSYPTAAYSQVGTSQILRSEVTAYKIAIVYLIAIQTCGDNLVLLSN